jgi:hypothetical protein
VIIAYVANSGIVNGFSGTNDNQHVLPLQVRQKQIKSLCGTNGKMMQVLLDNPSYNTLLDSRWQRVLEFALEKKCSALIDSGALTVGATSLQIALFTRAPQLGGRQLSWHPLLGRQVEADMAHYGLPWPVYAER